MLSCCQRAATRVTTQTFVKQQKNWSNSAEQAGHNQTKHLTRGVFLSISEGSKPFWPMWPGQGLWRGRRWTEVVGMARTWRLNSRPHRSRKAHESGAAEILPLEAFNEIFNHHISMSHFPKTHSVFLWPWLAVFLPEIDNLILIKRKPSTNLSGGTFYKTPDHFQVSRSWRTSRGQEMTTGRERQGPPVGEQGDINWNVGPGTEKGRQGHSWQNSHRANVNPWVC